MTPVHAHEEVRSALSAGQPVVALETAVLTHGLPAAAPSVPVPLPEGDIGVPFAARVMHAMVDAVRAAGAVPAVVAVIDGQLRIGLDADEINALAGCEDADKASVTGLAPVLAAGGTAGATVSATLRACRLAPGGPIRFFATGGIGGVHAGWTTRPDVSADLRELAITPTCVVCAGAKSVLDLPATVEWLETLGVPVVGFGTSDFPQFHALGDPSLPTPYRVDDAPSAAALCRAQWTTLACAGGVLLANPIPAAHALPADEVAKAVAISNQRADAAGVHGAARTPFLLEDLTRITDGKTLTANVALLLDNARAAAEVATAYAAEDRS
jgi:pseudouridine-5'-phosphate glycosidase